MWGDIVEVLPIEVIAVVVGAPVLPLVVIGWLAPLVLLVRSLLSFDVSATEEDMGDDNRARKDIEAAEVGLSEDRVIVDYSRDI